MAVFEVQRVPLHNIREVARMRTSILSGYAHHESGCEQAVNTSRKSRAKKMCNLM